MNDSAGHSLNQTVPLPERDIQPSPAAQLAQTVCDIAEQVYRQTEYEPALLDWNSGVDFSVEFQPFARLFTPPESGSAQQLPYLDSSIDLVLCPAAANHVQINEARRVARFATLVTHSDIRWKISLDSLPHKDQSPSASSPTNGHHALLCVPFLPTLDHNSGARRSAMMTTLLLDAGWTVALWVKNCMAHGGSESDTARGIADLESQGVTVYAGPETMWADDNYRPHLDSLLEDASFDLALVVHWDIAAYALPVLRAVSPRTRILIDSVDVHFLRRARAYFMKSSPDDPAGQLDEIYAHEMIRELNVYAAADGVLAVSQKEADLLNDFLNQTDHARPVPLLEPCAASTLPFEERRGILYIGNFLHQPNVDAVKYLLHDILPHLDSALLDQHPVYIVGTAAEQHVQDFAKGLRAVHIAGWLPDLTPSLQRARLTVIPLRYGAGSQRQAVAQHGCCYPSGIDTCWDRRLGFAA